ncbi:MAG: 4-hydroxythreonine-4-phosphate dehydrogenase PdxA [Rhodospirillales bacterium]|nr:4-hydroxythreonine-4-phosphate dehydrogenase PdxA [Rhodospirillales bacterium]
MNDATGNPAAHSPDRVLPLAVTMGDANGIGPDVTLMSWHARKRHELPVFAVYGCSEALRNRADTLGLDIPIASITSLSEAPNLFGGALPVRALGAPGVTEADSAVVASIEAATDAVLTGEALALVTNPIAKKSLRKIPLEYPGHTVFLGLLASRHYQGRRFHPTMMLVADELKVVPATVHIPVSAVAGTLTGTLIVDTVRTTAAALTEDFGILNPRIAVAGLNPHAGEGGLIGSEEVEIIEPAIAELVADGLAISGPHSADTLFHAEARGTYDAVVAMYHDQALIPLKTLAFDRGVNVTLGLPFVRTSPDHGTAYGLAGTGQARPDSFVAALQLAARLGKRRMAARKLAGK